MNLTSKQIKYYKGYILPSIYNHFNLQEVTPSQFNSIEKIDSYFKSFIKLDSLIQFTYENFNKMIIIIYEFCDLLNIKDKTGNNIMCLNDYDSSDYFKL